MFDAFFQTALEDTWRMSDRQSRLRREAQSYALTERLRAIVDRHPEPTFDGGMMGAMQMILSTRDPGIAKRKAAEALINARACRITLIHNNESHSAASAYWLRRARMRRECAAEFIAEQRLLGLPPGRIVRGSA